MSEHEFHEPEPETEGAPSAPGPPEWSLESDLRLLDPAFVSSLSESYYRDEIEPDEFYRMERQRAQDESSPLLQDIWKDRQAQAPPPKPEPIQEPEELPDIAIAISARPGVGGERTGEPAPTAQVGGGPGALTHPLLGAPQEVVPKAPDLLEPAQAPTPPDLPDVLRQTVSKAATTLSANARANRFTEGVQNVELFGAFVKLDEGEALGRGNIGVDALRGFMRGFSAPLQVLGVEEQEARRLVAQVLDRTITYLSAPFQLGGDVGAFIYAPIANTLRGLGASESSVQSGIDVARLAGEQLGLLVPIPGQRAIAGPLGGREVGRELAAQVRGVLRDVLPAPSAGTSLRAFDEAGRIRLRKGEAVLTLERYTNVEPGKTLDPRRPEHRAGLRQGAEFRRLAQGDPDAGPPRLYFYVAGTPPEPGVAGGRYKVTVKVPAARIYDIGEDPLKLAAGPDSNAVEQTLKAKKFGYRNSKSAMPNVVALFDDVPVSWYEDRQAPRFTVRIPGVPAGYIGSQEGVRGTTLALYNLTKDIKAKPPSVLYHGADAAGTAHVAKTGVLGGGAERVFLTPKFGLAAEYAHAKGGKVFAVAKRDLEPAWIDVAGGPEAIPPGALGGRAVAAVEAASPSPVIHPAGSTVTSEALEEAGYVVPFRDVVPFEVQAERRVPEIVAAHQEHGGSTISLASGNRVGREGVAVAVPTQTEVVDAITPEVVADFMARKREFLEDPRLNVGTWKRPDGKHEISLSVVVPDRELAETLGKQWDQMAVFDLKAFEEIATGGTGAGPKGFPADPRAVLGLVDDAARALQASRNPQTKLPLLMSMSDDFAKGEYGKDWYVGNLDELVAQLGEGQALPWTPDMDNADFAARLMAVASITNTPDEQVRIALREAYPRLKLAQSVEDADRAIDEMLRDKIITGQKPSGIARQFKVVIRGGEPTGMKINPFWRAMLGDEQAVVVDRWIWRLFYQKESGKPAQNAVITDIIRTEAARAGTTPARYQAGLWHAVRNGEAGPYEPLRDVIRRQLKEARDVDFLFPQVARELDEAGKVQMGTSVVLARAFLGGAIGYSLADSPEEGVAFALLGSGLGVSSSLRIAKAIGKQVRETPTLRVLSGGAPAELPPIAPDNLDALAAFYRESVAEQRRFVRPHEVAAAEAKELRRAGDISEDVLKQLAPGTTMDDAHAVATVETLLTSGMKLRVLARQYLKAPTPEAQQAFLEQWWMHAQTDPKRIGVIAESGRTLSVLNDPVSGKNAFLAQIETVFHDAKSGVTPEVLARILSEIKDPAQLAVASRAITKSGWSGAFKELIVNGMLWNPVSWIANGIGSVGAIGMSVPERALAEAAGRVLGLESGVAAGETWALIAGYWESLFDAGRLAWMGFKEGEEQFSRRFVTEAFERPEAAAQAAGARTKFGTVRKAISSDNLELTGPLGRAVDWFGAVVRVPQRVMTSTDDFFKTVSTLGEIKAQSHRQAAHEAGAAGLSGRELGEFMAERVPQLTANPGLTTLRDAKDFGLYTTFTREFGDEGLLNRVGRGLQTVSEHPAGKLVVPFVRTPINIAKYAGERTPLALVMRDFWTDLRGADVAKRELALSKLAFGSMVGSGIAYLASLGIVTGSGPRDPELKRHYRGAGWQPYAVNVSALKRLVTGADPTPKAGDTLHGFNRLEPVGMIMGMAADWTTAAFGFESAGMTTPEALLEGAATIAAVTAKNLSSKTFVKGLAETLNAITDPDRFGDRAASTFLSSLIPFSAGVRLVERISDPTLSEAQDVMDRIVAQVPGFSKSLPPYRDIFGEPWIPGGVYGPIPRSELKADPELRELARLEVLVPRVPKSLPVSAPGGQTTGTIALSPAERDAWAVARGKETDEGDQTLREAFKEAMSESAYQEGSDEYKRYRLAQVITRVHEFGRRRMLEQFPIVARSLEHFREQAVETFSEPTSPGVEALTPLLRSLGR